MSLFGREAKLKWKGKDHTLTVTMETVDKFESGPLAPNILEVGITLGSGAPKMTIAATAYSRLLELAGVSCTREDVYTSMMHELSGGSREMLDLCINAVSLMIPRLESDERPEHSKKA